MDKEYLKIEDSKIKLPEYELYKISEKKNKYLICIPVLNEGKKFIAQLKEMQEKQTHKVADIIVCDGGSNDGSAEPDILKKYGVSALVIRKSPGHMSDQLMLGYYYALINGYEGAITIDGNGKDGIDGIFNMAKALDEGYDLIQGSRYIKGGIAINTPKSREFAIKLIHVPVVNMLSGFRYTDTTNGFRAHSIKVFKDERIQPFRYGTFPTYALIHYLTVRIPRLGYKVTEVPVLRQYPAKGKIPTKISPIKGNIDLIKILWNMFRKKYNPKG
jgi:hypothetical protein